MAREDVGARATDAGAFRVERFGQQQVGRVLREVRERALDDLVEDVRADLVQLRTSAWTMGRRSKRMAGWLPVGPLRSRRGVSDPDAEEAVAVAGAGVPAGAVDFSVG